MVLQHSVIDQLILSYDDLLDPLQVYFLVGGGWIIGPVLIRI